MRLRAGNSAATAFGVPGNPETNRSSARLLFGRLFLLDLAFFAFDQFLFLDFVLFGDARRQHSGDSYSFVGQ